MFGDDQHVAGQNDLCKCQAPRFAHLNVLGKIPPKILDSLDLEITILPSGKQT